MQTRNRADAPSPTSSSCMPGGQSQLPSLGSQRDARRCTAPACRGPPCSHRLHRRLGKAVRAPLAEHPAEGRLRGRGAPPPVTSVALAVSAARRPALSSARARCRGPPRHASCPRGTRQLRGRPSRGDRRCRARCTSSACSRRGRRAAAPDRRSTARDEERENDERKESAHGASICSGAAGCPERRCERRHGARWRSPRRSRCCSVVCRARSPLPSPAEYSIRRLSWSGSEGFAETELRPAYAPWPTDEGRRGAPARVGVNLTGGSHARACSPRSRVAAGSAGWSPRAAARSFAEVSAGPSPRCRCTFLRTGVADPSPRCRCTCPRSDGACPSRRSRCRFLRSSDAGSSPRCRLQVPSQK